MNAALVVDVIIICLLIATISYAIILNRKLGVLRDARSELAGLLSGFGSTLKEAEFGLERIKGTAESLDAGLRERLQAAEQARDTLAADTTELRALSDDLAFLVKRASTLADRLEAPGRAHQAPPATALAADAPSLATARAAMGSVGSVGLYNRSGTDRNAQDPHPSDGGGDAELDRDLLAALQSLR